jgi:hypothetical protein
LQNAKSATVVKLTVVPCPPVVEVKIKRPDTKYQLGFSVQNGVVSLTQGLAQQSLSFEPFFQPFFFFFVDRFVAFCEEGSLNEAEFVSVTGLLKLTVKVSLPYLTNASSVFWPLPSER